MDLFDLANDNNTQNKPLADRFRAKTLDDFYGQEQVVGKGTLLRRAIECDRLGNCIFYGPPGCGKSTLAYIISQISKANCVRLNAVLSGVAEVKKVVEQAKDDFRLYGKKTYLILDECHRWNKAQSDSLLAPLEEGHIVFIGTTTENPYVNMTKAILSRCRIFEFHSLKTDDLILALNSALKKDEILKKYNLLVSKEAISHIAEYSCGDLRCALNALELAVISTYPDKTGKIIVDKSVAEQSIQKKSLAVDESEYYDMLSAFCKSLRGSDSDAAIYWAQRLIEAGLDPMIIARRLVVHSSEDVGMADPNALCVATSAMYALEKIGMPEGRIPLTNAIIYVCEAPKSNSVVTAMYAAVDAVVNTRDDRVPEYLRDVNYKIDKISGYKYPHDYGGWVEQEYLPQSLKNKVFYVPLKNGYEKNIIKCKVTKRSKQ